MPFVFLMLEFKATLKLTKLDDTQNKKTIKFSVTVDKPASVHFRLCVPAEALRRSRGNVRCHVSRR